MNGLAIVFPQFWLQSNCDDLFLLHIKTLRTYFCVVWHINHGNKEEPQMVQVDPILDAQTLCFQKSLFKLTMKSNIEEAMEEPEFIKIAKIAVTAVLGNVEDERIFSTLGFMKSKFYNYLSSHLNTTVKMFSQPFYKHDTFPYNNAITHWHE
jgi:hypothetical protein